MLVSLYRINVAGRLNAKLYVALIRDPKTRGVEFTKTNTDIRYFYLWIMQKGSYT